MTEYPLRPTWRRKHWSLTHAFSQWSAGSAALGHGEIITAKSHDGTTPLTWRQKGDRQTKIERQSYSPQRHSPSEMVFPTRLDCLNADSVPSLTRTIHVLHQLHMFMLKRKQNQTQLGSVIVWILSISLDSLRHWRLCPPTWYTTERWLDPEGSNIIDGLMLWWIHSSKQ